MQLTLAKHLCNLKAVTDLSFSGGLTFMTEWTEKEEDGNYKNKTKLFPRSV